MSIVEEFSKSKYIYDFFIDNNVIYYSLKKDISYSKLSSKFVGYELVQVPYIPYTKSGTVDKTALKGYLSNVDMDTLIEKSNSNCTLKETFIDVSTGFDTIKQDNSNISSDTIKNSNRLAIAYNGDLDWSALKYNSLSDLIETRKDSTQKLTYISANNQIEETYSNIYYSAKKIAISMQKNNIPVGSRLIFQFKSNQMFVHCYWACILAGYVIVPVGIMEDYSTKNINTEKISKIYNIFDNSYIITDDAIYHDVCLLNSWSNQKFNILNLQTFLDDDINGYSLNKFDWDLEQPLIFLFTSGSTGTPKGVGLSQRNVFARTLGEIQMYNFNESLVDFNIMTLTHAAGLIWSHTRDIYLDAFQIQCDTDIILKNPILWLEYMSKYKANTTWAPNFAFALVNDSVDFSKTYDWDLSHLHNVYPAGEMNNPKTLRLFLRNLSKYGMPDNAIIPGFGMTETSSCITYYNKFSYQNSSDMDKILSVGTPIRGCTLRIVDNNHNILKEGEVGYLECSGPSFLKEYYKNPEATKSSITEDGYLRTGDLGYIVDNNLTLTGREKDIIIINGLNYYAQDLEEFMDNVEGVKSGYTTIISIFNGSTEDIIAFFSPIDDEIFLSNNNSSLKKLCNNILKSVREKCFLNFSHIIPVISRDFPRSEIGKKQRNQLKKNYLNGDYDEILSQIEVKKEKPFAMQKVWINKSINIINSPIDDLKFTIISSDNTIGLEKYTQVRNFNDNLDVNLIDFRFWNIITNLDNVNSNIQDIVNLIKEYAGCTTNHRILIPIKSLEKQFSVLGYVINALCESLKSENSNVTFKLIETDKLIIKDIIKELKYNQNDYVVKYFNGNRKTTAFKTYSKPYNYSKSLSSQSVVAIFGGLGGIGIKLSKWLISNYDAKLILLGSSSLGEKQKEFNELLNESQNIFYQQVDITNLKDVENSIVQGEKYFNQKVSIMFNLVGKLSDTSTYDYYSNKNSHSVLLESINAYNKTISLKLDGTKNIHTIAKNRKSSLYVFSSVTSWFGSQDLSAYAISNAVQECYCERAQSLGDDVTCICWSMWNNIGMNYTYKTSKNLSKSFEDLDSELFGGLLGFSVEKALNILKCILLSDYGTYYIGLDRNSMRIQSKTLDEFQTILTISGNPNDIEQFKNLKEVQSLNVIFKYVSKIDSLNSKSISLIDLQNQLKNIWCNYLGIEDCEIDDNLFDIGGNSITIFNIVNTIKDKFYIDIKPVDIMINSDIQSLSTYILSINNSVQCAKLSEKSHIVKKPIRRRKV